MKVWQPWWSEWSSGSVVGVVVLGIAKSSGKVWVLLGGSERASLLSLICCAVILLSDMSYCCCSFMFLSFSKHMIRIFLFHNLTGAAC